MTSSNLHDTSANLVSRLRQADHGGAIEVSVATPPPCPICGSAATREAITAADDLVTHEVFDLIACQACGVWFTHSMPPPAEIGRYYESSQYCPGSDDAGGWIGRLYRAARVFTLRRKRAIVVKDSGLERGRILDVGCGTGAFLEVMKKLRWRVAGVEPGTTPMRQAESRTGCTVFRALAALDEGLVFDAVSFWHALEHVPDPASALRIARAHLSPTGVLFVAVPNRDCLDARLYGPGWAGYDPPRHLFHFSPTSLARLLETAGFEVVRMRPMLLDPFYVALLSEQRMGRAGNLLRGLWRGFRSWAHASRGPARATSILVTARRQ